MQNIERVIKKSLNEKTANLRRSDNCLSELELSKYLDGSLPLSARERVEKHLADCAYCLDILAVAKDVLKDSSRKQDMGQRLAKQKWLILTVLSFLLSFFVKKYFMQFLVLSLILGIKWALSGEGSRNLVMIFRGLKHTDYSETQGSKKIFARK